MQKLHEHATMLCITPNSCLLQARKLTGPGSDHTVVVGCDEEDAAGLVPDEALDPRLPRRLASLGLTADGLGGEHLGEERVAARAGPDLAHLNRRRRHSHGD